MSSLQEGQYADIGNAAWIECCKDYYKFLGLLDELLKIPEQITPPRQIQIVDGVFTGRMPTDGTYDKILSQ